MTYEVTRLPDTVPFAVSVDAWMRRYWKHGPCPVCQAEDKWLAEPRVFGAHRLPVQTGLLRDVFIVSCRECGYVIQVNARTAGVRPSPIPNDLSGLEEGGGHSSN